MSTVAAFLCRSTHQTAKPRHLHARHRWHGEWPTRPFTIDVWAEADLISAMTHCQICVLDSQKHRTFPDDDQRLLLRLAESVQSAIRDSFDSYRRQRAVRAQQAIISIIRHYSSETLRDPTAPGKEERNLEVLGKMTTSLVTPSCPLPLVAMLRSHIATTRTSGYGRRHLCRGSRVVAISP